MKALIDCGASKTLICHNRLVASGKSQHFKISPLQGKIEVASALQDIGAEVLGTILINVSFNTEKPLVYPIRAYVVSGLSHVCFLGNDFLSSNNLILTTKSHLVLNPDPSEEKLVDIPKGWPKVPIQQLSFGPQSTLLSSTIEELQPMETKMIQAKTSAKELVFDLNPSRSDITIPHSSMYRQSLEEEMYIPITNNTGDVLTIQPEEELAQIQQAEQATLMSLRILQTDMNVPFQSPIFQHLERLDNEDALPGDGQDEVVKTNEELIDSVDLSHLTKKRQNEYKELLKRNIDIFSKFSTDIGKTNLFVGFTKVKPDLDPADFQAKHIPIPLHLREKTQKLCNQLIQAEVLRYATTPVPCLTNVHVRVKPNGNIRLCLDSRSTNYFTERLAAAATYTLDEILTKLQGKMITMIDVSQSFFNIPLHPDAWQHFSFLDPEKRVLQLTRACQGHHNSPAFQSMAMRLMLDLPASADKVDTADLEKETRTPMSDIKEATPTNFLTATGSNIDQAKLLPPLQLPTDKDDYVTFNIWDDLAVTSNKKLGHEGHFKALQMLFNKIRKGRMKLRIEKLQLCTPKITLLGMEYSGDYIHIPVKRLQALHSMSTHTPRAVKSFVASAAYYRSFCPSFSGLARSLIKASHLSKTEFKWTKELEEAKLHLLETIEKNSKRRIINEKDPLIVSTDASKFCAAATLETLLHGKTCLVSSFSRLFTDVETRHNIFAKEAATVVAAFQHFEYYLRGCTNLKLRTDVKALTYVKQTATSNSVAFRLSNEISKYDFTIEHVPTNAHFQADYLSRFRQGLEKEETSPDRGITSGEAVSLLLRTRVEKGAIFTQKQAENLLYTGQLPSLVKPSSPSVRNKAPNFLPQTAVKHYINKPNFVRKSKATESGKWKKSTKFVQANVMTLRSTRRSNLSPIRESSSVSQQASDKEEEVDSQNPQPLFDPNRIPRKTDAPALPLSGHKKAIKQRQDKDQAVAPKSEHSTINWEDGTKTTRIQATSQEPASSPGINTKENKGPDSAQGAAASQTPVRPSEDKGFQENKEVSKNSTVSENRTIPENQSTVRDPDDTHKVDSLKAAQETLDLGFLTPETFRTLQETDKRFGPIFGQKLPYKKFKLNANNLLCATIDGIEKICIPSSLIKPATEIKHKPHPHMHVPAPQVVRQLQTLFHNPNLPDMVYRIIEKCIICTWPSKPVKRKITFDQILHTNTPREAFYIDIMDTSSTQQKVRYGLVAVDAATNYIVALPITNRTKEEIIEALKALLYIPFGAPRFILADNESSFTASETLDYIQAMGTTIHFIAPHSPWSNQAEKAIKKIKQFLHTNTAHEQWTTLLPTILSSINATPFKHAKHSPEFFFFGGRTRKLNPFPLVENATHVEGEDYDRRLSEFLSKRRLLAQQKRIQENKKRTKRTFDEGELVVVREDIIKSGSKILAPKSGLYVIQSRIADNSYWLQDIATKSMIKKHATFIFRATIPDNLLSLSEGWDRMLSSNTI